jgi:hypothetical protein
VLLGRKKDAEGLAVEMEEEGGDGRDAVIRKSGSNVTAPPHRFWLIRHRSKRLEAGERILAGGGRPPFHLEIELV